MRLILKFGELISKIFSLRTDLSKATSLGVVMQEGLIIITISFVVSHVVMTGKLVEGNSFRTTFVK